MKLPTGLFYAMIVIIVFVMLFQLEPMLTENRTAGVKALADAYGLSERMRNEVNFDFQLQNGFNRFREQLYHDHEALFKGGMASDLLQHMPPHTLAVAISDNAGGIDRYADLLGNSSSELVRMFVRLDYLYTQKQEDVFFSEKYADELSAADRLLREFLGNKGDLISVLQLRASRLSIFNSPDRSTGLYWDSQTLKTGQKAYFFSRFDLTDIDPYFSIRLLLGELKKPGVLCAFYDLKKGRFIAGSRFMNFLKNPASADLVRSCRALKESLNNSGQSVAVVNSAAYHGIIGRKIVSFGVVPVVVTEKTRQLHSAGFRASHVFIFAMICMMLTVFIQTFCFGRGLSVSVGKALILASLLAIFMPFMLGRSVFSLILTEASENESLKLERELHNLISGMDSGVRLFHGNVLQNFRRILFKSDTIKGLVKEEQGEARYRAANQQGIEDEGAVASFTGLVGRLAVEVFEPLARGMNMAIDNQRKANAIIVMGPGGFIRYFDRYKNLTYFSELLPETDSLFMILSLYRRTVEKFFLPEVLAPGLRTVEKSGKAGELERFKFEEIRNHVAASVGNEKLHEMLVNFEGLNHFRTTVGLVNFSVFPVWSENLIRYFCGVSWDEMATSRLYIARAYAGLNRGHQEAVKGVRSFFSWIDPASYFPKPPTFVQAYGNIRGEMLCSEGAESARMGMYLKSSNRSKKTIKERTTGDDEALYLVMPGRFFTLYMLGGRQDTAYLRKIEEWRAFILVVGMAIFVIFAVLAAVNISRSVSSPLEHLLWGISMIERNDYSVRLKDSRDDEFGSISRAFNLMARRLRERDTLGKFVSPSVRKLAGNPELFQLARQGAEAEVTVLFADMEGFAAFAATADCREVQDRLQLTLSQFYQIAEELGGEVDKVIGGKMLIVFHHQRMSRKSAAFAAVRLALRIIEIFQADKIIRPVFGLNSGKVICGIIGAPAVRMDNTVIGDPVNVAARLCSLADSREMPLVISGDIMAELGDSFAVKKVECEAIKGKKQEVDVYSLLISSRRKT